MAENTHSDSEAESQDAEQLAQAAATDAVFENLPDTLIAPADGPAVSLTPDFQGGYEANDFYLGATQAMFDMGGSAVLMSPLEPYTGALPDFTPAGLGLDAAQYSTGGGANLVSIMPWGFVGDGPISISMADASGADEIIAGGSGAIIGEPTPFALRDPIRVRGSTQEIVPQDYQAAMHMTGAADGLLDMSNTACASGIGGYSQSQIPTTILSTDLASTGAPSKNESATMAAAAAPQTKADDATKEGATSPSEPTWMNNGQPPGDNTAADDSAPASDSSDESNVAVTVTIVVWAFQPDPNKEPADVEDRSSGEPETTTDQTKQQLASADSTAQTTPQVAYGPPVGGAAGTTADPSATSNAESGNGPALSLTPDFRNGYEANDFYLGATQAMFDYGGAAVLATPLEPYTGAPPDFTPSGLGMVDTPYGAGRHPFPTGWMFNSGAAVNNIMPWGLVGTAQSPVTLADTFGADQIIDAGMDVATGIPTPFALRDPLRVRGSTQEIVPQDYQTAMHFAGTAAALLTVADPSGGKTTLKAPSIMATKSIKTASILATSKLPFTKGLLMRSKIRSGTLRPWASWAMPKQS